MNKVITETMRICSQQVRCVSCRRCLHYEECRLLGTSCSGLARYLTWLTYQVLPPIEAELNRVYKKGLKLEARTPILKELRYAFTVVRVYEAKSQQQHTIARVMLGEHETASDIKTLIFKTYIHANYKKGK